MSVYSSSVASPSMAMNGALLLIAFLRRVLSLPLPCVAATDLLYQTWDLYCACSRIRTGTFYDAPCSVSRLGTSVGSVGGGSPSCARRTPLVHPQGRPDGWPLVRSSVQSQRRHLLHLR